MEVSMSFFIKELKHIVNWDSKYVVRTPFSDFLGVHEGKCVPDDVANFINQNWEKHIISDSFKNGFANVVQTSDNSIKWKEWILTFLENPCEVKFEYSFDVLKGKLAEIGEIRIEILERELRQIKFDLKHQTELDGFELSERKRSIKEALTFCAELKEELKALNIWATQYWEYDFPINVFRTGQFMDTFELSFEKKETINKKPKHRVIALYLFYKEAQLQTIAEMSRLGKIKKEIFLELAQPYGLHYIRLMMTFNSVSKNHNRTEPKYTKQLQEAINLLSSEHLTEAISRAETDLKTAKARKK